MVASAETTSATGCERAIPVNPQRLENIISKGMNASPERISDKIDACTALRVLWYSIFVGIDKAKNSEPIDAYLTAGAPSAMTSGDFWNSHTIFSAKISPETARPPTSKKPISIKFRC